MAYLDEANLERLRQIMWDMNEVTWEVETQTHEVETTPPTDTTADATAATTGEDFGTRTALGIGTQRRRGNARFYYLWRRRSEHRIIQMKMRTIPPPPR